MAAYLIANIDVKDPAAYEEHIATPTTTDLESLAPGVRVLRTERATNVAEHRAVVERVAARLASGQERQ